MFKAFIAVTATLMVSSYFDPSVHLAIQDLTSQAGVVIKDTIVSLWGMVWAEVAPGAAEAMAAQ